MGIHEVFRIGDSIEVSVSRIESHTQVRLGIVAPREVAIVRRDASKAP